MEAVYDIAGTEALIRMGKAGTAFIPCVSAIGHVSAEYAYLYPPGSPLIVPGERITEEVVRLLGWYLAEGYSVEGLKRGRIH